MEKVKESYVIDRISLEELEFITELILLEAKTPAKIDPPAILSLYPWQDPILEGFSRGVYSVTNTF